MEAELMVSRKRNKPDRYGNTSENMDAVFELIDKSTSTKNTDNDVVDLPGLSIDVSNSGTDEKSTFEVNGSQKPLERKLARFEAKIDQMHMVLIQIQRACISNATTSLLELDDIHELPLVSEEMLNKFELDLSQESYRQKIVSMEFKYYFQFLLNCDELSK